MSDFTESLNCYSGKKLHIPAGEYVIDDPVTISYNVDADPGAVFIVSQSITLLDASSWCTSKGKHNIIKNGNNHLFIIKGTEVEISGLVTDENLSTGGYTFFIDCSTSRQHIRLSKIRTYGSTGLIADGGQGIIVDLRLDDILAKQHRGRGSYLTRTFAYIFLRQCTIDYVGSNNPNMTNVPAWVFIGTEGLDLDSVDVLGTAIQGNVPLQYGFYFENVRALTIKQAMADNCGGFGFYFKSCNWIDASILKASMCGDVGVLACNGTSNLRISNLYVSGRNGLPGNRGAALLFTDSTVFNIHSMQTIAHNGVVNGGVAASNFTHSWLVT